MRKAPLSSWTLPYALPYAAARTLSSCAPCSARRPRGLGLWGENLGRERGGQASPLFARATARPRRAAGARAAGLASVFGFGGGGAAQWRRGGRRLTAVLAFWWVWGGVLCRRVVVVGRGVRVGEQEGMARRMEAVHEAVRLLDRRLFVAEARLARLEAP